MGIKSNITTPLRKETYKSLQLNAGVILVNFDLSPYSDAAALKTALATEIQDGVNLLGATRGGGTFTITRDIREVEADGARSRFKGSEIVDNADAFLSTTLIEITPDHLKSVLGSVTVDDSNPNHIVMTLHTAFEDEDYLDSVVWVGDTSEGFMAIELLNALNTADFTFTYSDKNEGTANVEYHAHQEDVESNEDLPAKLHWFNTDENLGTITVTSAAGTNVGETALSTTNTLASGEKYVYKVGTSGAAPSISYKEEADYTWTEWDGASAINVGASANGKKATVAVLNGSGKAVKAGSVTLAVKTA